MPETPIDIPLTAPLEVRPEVPGTATPPGIGADPRLGLNRVIGAQRRNLIDSGGVLFPRQAFESLPYALVTGNGGGVFTSSTGTMYSIQGTTLYKNFNSVVGSVVSGQYTFAEQPLNANVFLQSGANGYVITGGTAVSAITDTTFTGTNNARVPGTAYLDGTYYVMTSTGAIYGCKNLNDPTVWDPLNLINAWQDGSVGTALAVHRNYILAFTPYSIQVFQDAGNPVASPLSPLLQMAQPFGTQAPQTIVEINKDLFFLASTRNRGVRVVHMSNLRAEVISTPDLDMFLTRNFLLFGVVFYGWTVTMHGRQFYCLTFNGVTLAYDLAQKSWDFWDLPVTFPPKPQGAVYGQLSGPGAAVQQVVQDLGSNVLYSLTESVAGRYDVYSGLQRTTTPIIAEVTTPKVDGGTILSKVATRLELFSDQANQGRLGVSWSDDDYQTWTPWRYVDLSQGWAVLEDLGTFRRRAFRFRHDAASPVRLQAAKLFIMPGVI